ncbi:MAG: diacylglycerol kinase [Pseudomonadota bacterium]
MKPGDTGFKRIIKAGIYSIQGFKAAYQYEAAFRQELFAGIFLIPIAFWIASSGIELVILIASLLLVLICEIINSAIEAVVDRQGEEYHILAGRAKDMGSAAVFLALLNAGFCWFIISINY